MVISQILMIENDEDDRLLTKENFEKDWPTAVIEFVSGSEVADRLQMRGHPPHLILLSMNIRPYSGIDLIKLIRAEKGYEAIPIIVLSESALPEEIRESYTAGASSFIKKPSGYGEALSKIKAFIAYWRHIVELPSAV
jgi:CheY-like chemotaxis protein